MDVKRVVYNTTMRRCEEQQNIKKMHSDVLHRSNRSQKKVQSWRGKCTEIRFFRETSNEWNRDDIEIKKRSNRIARTP